MATARYYPGSFPSHDSRPLDTRGIVYLAVAVAALCAFSVFALLFERDHSFLHQVSLYDAATYLTQSTAAAPSTVAPADTRHPLVQQTTVHPVPGYLPFTITRSRHFQRVGPISVGIWKTDPKHALYDVGLLIAGQRFEKAHVSTDEALAIKIGNAAPMELVVNRVGRNDVSGYLSTPGQADAH